MFVSVNGVRLFFDVDGEKLVTDGPLMRERPTLLLLHGGPGLDHTMFKPAFAPLAEVAQVIYLDHRGNGLSEHGDPALWTLDQWGDDVLGFCDALGIEKPIVLGLSFGGLVAQSYATRHPAHPAKLVLYSTTPVLEDEPVLDAFEAIGGPKARAVAAAHFAGRTPETTAAFLSICFPLYNTKPIDPDVMRRWLVNDAVAAHFLDGEGKRVDFRPVLGRIACPTLVVAGAKDPRAPLPFARMIAAAIRPELVRLEIFENCGHAPNVEEPERVMELLRAFISA
ncbi:MAG: alpha/beta fold hydrolase [Proteobacteria bacterium]|nr:alpha/beta fold hydrolase [Pseudomonadota bacterium]